MTSTTSPTLNEEAAIPPLTPPPKRSSTRQVLAAAALGLSVFGVLGAFAYKSITKRQEAVAPPAEAAVASTPKVQFSDTPPETIQTAKSAAPAASAPGQPGYAVPAIEKSKAEPIPVRPNNTGAGAHPHRAQLEGDESLFPVKTSDAGAGPMSRDIISYPDNPTGAAQANLRRYQDQLGGVVAQLKSLSDTATRNPGTSTAAAFLANGQPAAPGQISGGVGTVLGSLERSTPPMTSARTLANRSLIVPKGALFLCSLKTRVVTSASGFVGCQLERNVFSEDGKVVLAERGSHLDGEYRIVQVRPGTTRIPVLWTRLRTPHGIVVDLDSPATGALGESGIDGYVDNRWPERIGAALLVSLIDDAIKVASSDSSNSGSSTVLLPSTTSTGSKLAERVLEATINIPPLIYQNQGSTVGVYVARDLDFSHVYTLAPQ